MVSVIELLLETLAPLTDKEFRRFKWILTDICPNIHDTDILLLTTADKRYLVFAMVRNYSQKSVDMIKSALLPIVRPGPVQSLSQSSSGYESKTIQTRMRHVTLKFIIYIIFSLHSLYNDNICNLERRRHITWSTKYIFLT